MLLPRCAHQCYVVFGCKLIPLHKDELGPCAPGDYPVHDGHPLVYASLLNHGNYFLEQPTRKPGHTEERGRPVRQQWFVTHQVTLTHSRTSVAFPSHQTSAPLLRSPLTTSCTTTSKSAQHHLYRCVDLTL